jgi:NADH-quinone oxidoreductase subunit E
VTAEEVLERLSPEFEKRAAPYARRTSALLSLLHAVQDAFGYVPPEGEEAVARFLGVGANRVHEAVTFYTLFRRRPAGKYHIQVCRTLSCDLTGGGKVLAALERRLGVTQGQVTPDGLFSFESVECLGCCDKAPALHVNKERFRGPLTEELVEDLLDELRAREGGDGHA